MAFPFSHGLVTWLQSRASMVAFALEFTVVINLPESGLTLQSFFQILVEYFSLKNAALVTWAGDGTSHFK